MSFNTLLLLLNFSIVIPAFLFFLKIQIAVKHYLPFILFIWLGLLNDTLSYAIIIHKQSNLLNSNIYIFIEYIILLAQFCIWNKAPVFRYVLIGLAGLLIWVLDNVVLNNITANNSIFRLFFSLAIVLFSLDQINKVIIFERGLMIKNAVFLICCGFILYFGCKAFLESFNIFHVGLSGLFLKRLFIILSVVNLLANLLYSSAILCIPRKQEFSMPY